MRTFAISVVALMILAALAGCIGGNDTAKPASTKVAANNTTATNGTLPDGRGVSAGAIETNKTVNSTVDGKDHKHDYWKGATNVVVFSNDVAFGGGPVYPEGQGTNPESIAYLKLPHCKTNQTDCTNSLVYEGTTSLDVKVLAPRACADPSAPCGPDPQAPAMKLRYRSAADNKFRDAGVVAYGQPLSIPISAKETDMPHSVGSLWAFELITEKPTEDFANVTITIHKGNEVVNWPGHPDFYADKESRVVLDKDFKVHRSGVDENVLYGAGSSWQAPDKLISYGTGRIEVFLNVTKATSSNGAQATDFILEYHDATILDAEDQYNERVWDMNGHDGFKYNFTIKVNPDGMDGPYQPGSLWGFRPVAFFANAGTPEDTPVVGGAGVGLCPGCFPYDIEYHLTIVAHKGDGAAMIMSG